MHVSPAGTSTDRREAKAQSLSYVILLATTTAISGFLFGFDTAVINGVLLLLRREFALSNLQTEVAASSLLLGCLLGAAGASVIGDRYGRKNSLIFSAVLFAISSVGAATASTVILFSLARLLGGLAIGLASVLTPVYIAEISPSKNRGTLVSLNQLAIVIGILVAFLVSWQLSRLGTNSWRWMLGVAAIPSIAFLGGLLAIPESPRWLLSKGRHREGERILARIFGAKEAEAQVQAVERAAATEEGSWREVFSPGMRQRLAVGMTLALFCQITGINTVLYYGSIIISEHFPGESTGMALAANVIIGTVNLVFTIVAMIFLDRWGRRAILMTASGGMGLSLTLLVIGLNVHGAPAILMLVSILCYVAFFALGMGPGPWLIISEIFPTKVRGRAASIATSTLWTGTLVVTFTFLSLVNVLHLWGTFAIYGALSFVCFFYVWKAVPETKGRTLEQIQEAWGK
ncbi:MAG TPA: sugar porter family MFS transporter [Candidatus Acidoferrales bacterium]|nr:sugar porter family MFS transporter [Candidatus Acidoferrales bacterium]